jgi:peroxiredoxin
LKALRDSAEAIAAFDVAVYMVSLDDAEKNRAFAEELKAKHVVLSDPLEEAADAYVVLALGGLYARRWTFYIDERGRIRHIDKDVNVASAGQDIARTLETLGFPRAE